LLFSDIIVKIGAQYVAENESEMKEMLDFNPDVPGAGDFRILFCLNLILARSTDDWMPLAYLPKLVQNIASCT
jgi:hypothetical protein